MPQLGFSTAPLHHLLRLELLATRHQVLFGDIGQLGSEELVLDVLEHPLLAIALHVWGRVVHCLLDAVHELCVALKVN
ncbi:hypothetical protein CVT25_006454 [Psilocybe cyanescens]|uniref:Uncharacterized protein n=1 Tax=Psilocybe cyanescens TaxID=93625 RepID=A0A409XEC1_PSICY|nr:hypothetical protein CVT25_006454 [Psilocybe cyanescens]